MDAKIPVPKSGNAFQDGMLNAEVATAVINDVNKPWKVKLKGAPDGKIVASKEGVTIDLAPMFGEGVEVRLIKNGELRRAMIPIRWLD